MDKMPHEVFAIRPILSVPMRHLTEATELAPKRAIIWEGQALWLSLAAACGLRHVCDPS